MGNFTAEEYLAVANQLIANGAPIKAKTFFEKCLLLEPDNALALSGIGILHADKMEWNEALEFFNRSIKADAENPEAYYHRSGVFIKQENWSEAIRDLDKAINLCGYFHYDYYALLAWCLLKAEMYDNCNAVCDVIRETHFDNHTAYSYKYKCLQKLQRYEELITLSKQQLHAGHDNADYHNNLGYAYLLANELQKAVHALDDCLNWEPEHAYALNNKGLALFKIGHYEKAYPLFCGSIEYDIANPLAYFNRALYYLNAGRKVEAKEDLLKARELGYAELFDAEADKLLFSEFKIAATDLT